MKSKSWLTKHRPTAVLFLFVFSALLFLAAREAHHILSVPVSSWTLDSSADCGVVLTGGAGRVREGLALLERGQIKTLIISGVHPQTELRDLLTPFDFSIGVLPSQVILERRSQTTYGNAQQSTPILEALHCHDFMLVTSVVHMYRAQKTFQAALPDQIHLIPYAIAGAKVEDSYFGLATEVLKSLFYSVWAYV